jgi:hypothetical protein
VYWLRPSDIARCAGVAIARVRADLDAGRLAGICVEARHYSDGRIPKGDGGRRWRIPLSAVRQYLGRDALAYDEKLRLRLYDLARRRQRQARSADVVALVAVSASQAGQAADRARRGGGGQ